MADDRLITNALDAVQLLAEQGRQLRADLNRAQQMAQYWRTSYNTVRADWQAEWDERIPARVVPDPAAGYCPEDTRTPPVRVEQNAGRAEAAAAGDAEYGQLRAQVVELTHSRNQWKDQAETNTRLLKGEIVRRREAQAELATVRRQREEAAAESATERDRLLESLQRETERATRLQCAINSLVHAADSE